MKKLAIAILAASAMFVSTVACGGGSSSSSRGGGISGGSAVDVLNRGLAEVSYSPGGKGFGYKSYNVPASDLNKWAKDHKDQIESVLSKVPSGYVLQVTGHSDSVGPRTRVGSKPGNVFWSTQRAKAVFNALKAQGVPTDKMTYKGVADDIPSSQCAEDEACQRRVSLQVVEK